MPIKIAAHRVKAAPKWIHQRASKRLVMQGEMLEWVVLFVCCFFSYLCCNFGKWRHYDVINIWVMNHCLQNFVFHLHIFRFWIIVSSICIPSAHFSVLKLTNFIRFLFIYLFLLFYVFRKRSALRNCSTIFY